MPDPRDTQRAARLRQRDGSAAEAGQEVAALRYDSAQDYAPKLLARGRGHLATKILELAEANDVPVKRDPTLVSILGALDVGAEIPPDLYGVIAEVLAWAYHVDSAAAERSRRAA